MPDKRDNRWLAIVAVVAIIALAGGTCLGTAIGGLGGYLLGQRSLRSLQLTPEAPLVPTSPRDRAPQTITPVPPETRDNLPPLTQPPSGAWIRTVLPGSPAEEAGLQIGDIITHVDGKAVGEPLTLAEMIGEHRPGDRLELTVRRLLQMRLVLVELASHPTEPGAGYLGVRYRDIGKLSPPGED